MSKVSTRDRILDAALSVFAGKGYHRATVDDIVRASATSKGAVYHHFSNKEAVFVALVDDFTERLAATVATAIGTPRAISTKPWPRARSPRSTPAWPPSPGSAPSTKS